ncbi:MAG: molybdate ABC transporter substrate-binding protein [Verrucomicrobiota bacterium]|jgi:molybdate transport system substrate-binding protein|nr:molybdate ABC transporter substrate-binding protein [Verrucomicrobiota bacterium]
MKKLLAMALAMAVAASAWAGDVYVAAAASLTDVMKAVQAKYEQAHPAVKLTVVYGATGMLRTQVLQGAPCDVFIGADRWFGGAESNAAEVVRLDTVRVVACNTLVAVAGREAPPAGGALADWLGGAKKIGVGNPASVPAGRYAKKLLESEKLWDANTPKYVFGTNVREVLLWLRQGVVQVGFVYGSDLVAANDAGLKTLATYETPGGGAIELAGGVAKNAKNAAEALAFLDALKAPEAQAALRDLGFTVK